MNNIDTLVAFVATTRATRFWTGTDATGKLAQFWTKEPRAADFPALTIKSHLIVPVYGAGDEISAAPAQQYVPAGGLAPKWAGEFATFQHWVSKAQSLLAGPAWRPAICIDAKGRRCAIGADFMRARDEGAFPVRYFWECEPAPTPVEEGADL